MVDLVRNPRFRVWSAAAQPDGYPDKIVERYGYTGASAIHAVERGTADITADGPRPDLAARARSLTPDALLEPALRAPQLRIFGLWLNTRVAPFNDVRVRQALNLAVNRNRLVQINGGTITRVACQILPPNVNGYSPTALLPVQRARPGEGPPARRRVGHQG